MADFIRVAKLEDIAEPGKQLVEVDDRLVVLFRVEGEIYCLDDICTHDGGPLGEGELSGFSIACPRHGACFDVRSGNAITMPATEATVAHEVKVEGGEIFVKLNEV
jgi:3-phenylpropionate/trans-cinnamate dioxygenase ferredoxin subunit